MINLKGIWSVQELDLQPREFPIEFAISPNGSAWVQMVQMCSEFRQGVEYGWSETTRMLHLRENAIETYEVGSEPFPKASGYGFHNMTCTKAGGLWYYTLEGFLCYYDGEKANIFYQGQDGLPMFQGVPHLVIDQNDTLWLTLGEAGIACRQGTTWHIFDRSTYPLLDGTVTSVALDTAGQPCFAISNQGLTRIISYTGKHFEHYLSLPEESKHETIGLMLFDSSDALWLAWDRPYDQSRLGLWVIDENGTELNRFTKQNSHLPRTEFEALSLDSQGRIWVGTGEGIAVFEGAESACWMTIEVGKIQRAKPRKTAEEVAYGPNQLFQTYVRRRVAVDSAGHIWALSNHGLAQFKEH